MVSWQTIQSLLIFFGPLLLPRIIAYARSIRTASRQPKRIKPLSPLASHALHVLFITGCIAFLSTLPFFAPKNIFRQTQSRLNTPASVILTRLSHLRPLTPADEELRAALDAGALESRLLYARLGPDAITHCALSGGAGGGVDAETQHFLCAVPRIAAPHILHLLALGLATSQTIAGAEGARWRAAATVAGLVLAVAELGFIATYDDTHNARATRYNDVDFVYWKLRVWRGLGIAALDALLGWVIWLQATGRAFLAPIPASERASELGKSLEGVMRKIVGVGVVRNGTLRDAEFRKVSNDYWIKENEVMKDVLEQPEVLQAQRNALGRVDATRVARDADALLDSILSGARPAPAAAS